MEIQIPVFGPEVLKTFTCDTSVKPVQAPPEDPDEKVFVCQQFAVVCLVECMRDRVEECGSRIRGSGFAESEGVVIELGVPSSLLPPRASRTFPSDPSVYVPPDSQNLSPTDATQVFHTRTAFKPPTKASPGAQQPLK